MTPRKSGNLASSAVGLIRALLAAGLLASAAAAQFDLLTWELQMHGGDGISSLTPSTMKLSGDPTTGSSLSYVSRAPVALRVYSGMSFNAFKNQAGTSAPLTIVGSTVTELIDETISGPVVFDVPALGEFGFGLLQKSLGWTGVVFYGSFTPTPMPTTATGASAGDGLGAALANVGDVNGDGIDDLIAGMPHHAGVGPASGGALLLSGADASVLMEFGGAAAGDEFGAAVAGAGDVDGDGVPDVMVGAPRSAAAAGAALVFSGADGSLLHTFTGSAAGDELGRAVAGAGDVNGDGFADLIVGAPHADPAGPDSGAALVYSGADGSLLHAFSGSQADAQAGTAVAMLGDVDGDAHDDVVVSAPLDGAGFGAVRIYSGSGGGLLHSLAGAQAGWMFGAALAATADLDGDGVRDLLVGVPKQLWGRVHAYSGATGAKLFETTASSSKELGSSVAAAGDINGDGLSDVLAGTPELTSSSDWKKGLLYVFSGRDGSFLWKLGGMTTLDAFGTAEAGAGDRDGDGLAEIAIGVPGLDTAGANAGGVVLQDFFVTWFDLGQGIAGAHGIPVLKGTGLLFADTPVTVKLSNAFELFPSTLIIGFSQLGAPLKGGVLVPQPDVIIGGLPTGAAGGFTLSSTWPAGVPSGLELFLQAWIPDPLAPHFVSASNALRLRTP